MRFTLLIFALAACGKDVMTDPEDEGSLEGTLPDAGGGGGAVADAMPVPPDGIPPGLAPCDEAVYHSDFTFIQEKVFDVSCTTKCHGDSPPAAHMSLLPGQSHAALINVTSHYDATWKRVVPGNPGASMLMVQIGGEPGPELEGFMPWGQPKLCTPLIDAIRRWIAAGALP